MKSLTGLAGLILLAAATTAPSFIIKIDQTSIESIPDGHGLAGVYAGTSNGTLLVAGGANFPNGKPWEGGQKVWHDALFALQRPSDSWKSIGRLPRAAAYGVSCTYQDKVICVAGCDATRHLRDAFCFQVDNQQLTLTDLPDLPVPTAYACGALVGQTLYVAGGQESPDALTTLHAAWSLDLAAENPSWISIEVWPGRGRMLAIAANSDDAFWLIGGVDLQLNAAGRSERVYLDDAYCYRPGEGWTAIAKLPHPIAASPSPAPVKDGKILIIGGDDGAQVGHDPRIHRGFNQQILTYDPTTQRWSEQGRVTEPTVTVPCVSWSHTELNESTWLVTSGEVRPGVRSPRVRTVEIDTQD